MRQISTLACLMLTFTLAACDGPKDAPKDTGADSGAAAAAGSIASLSQSKPGKKEPQKAVVALWPEGTYAFIQAVTQAKDAAAPTVQIEGCPVPAGATVFASAEEAGKQASALPVKVDVPAERNGESRRCECPAGTDEETGETVIHSVWCNVECVKCCPIVKPVRVIWER